MEVAPAPEEKKPGLLPWILAACVATGLLAGLGFAVSRTQKAPIVAQEVPAAIVPAPVLVEKTPDPAPVEAKPAEPKAEVGTVEPVAAAVPEATSRLEPIPPAQAATVAALPDAPKTKGTIMVEAIPYGSLFINGKKVDDVVGMRRFQLIPGTYTFSWEHPQLRRTDTVNVKAGQTQRLSFHPLEK